MGREFVNVRVGIRRKRAGGSCSGHVGIQPVFFHLLMENNNGLCLSIPILTGWTLHRLMPQSSWWSTLWVVMTGPECRARFSPLTPLPNEKVKYSFHVRMQRRVLVNGWKEVTRVVIELMERIKAGSHVPVKRLPSILVAMWGWLEGKTWIPVIVVCPHWPNILICGRSGR